MKPKHLRVKQTIETRPDATGEVIRWHFKEVGRDGDVFVEMFAWQANSLLMRLLQSGVVAAEIHGPAPALHPDGVERLPTLHPTRVDASFDGAGSPMLAVRFGRLALGVRLSSEQARTLSRDLAALGTHIEPPSTAQ